MHKESQPDKKEIAVKKAKGQVPPPKGYKTQSNNVKKQSNKPNDV